MRDGWGEMIVALRFLVNYLDLLFYDCTHLRLTSLKIPIFQFWTPRLNSLKQGVFHQLSTSVQYAFCNTI